MKRGARPSLVLVYSYRLPFRKADPATPEGVEYATRLARAEERFARYADDMAGLLLRRSGTAPVTPAVETARSLAWKQIEKRCRAAAVDE